VEDYRDTLIILLADVATNYVEARSYQERLQIAREILRLQNETLRLAESRLQLGIGNRLDVSQARADSETTAAEIPALQIGYQQALNRLSLLVAQPPGTVDQFLAEPQPVPAPPGEIAVGIPAELLRRRPDIRRAEKELAAQTARIGAAVGEMYPKFSILGSFGLDARDFSKLFDGNAISASVGPSMQWNILNFGKLRCNVYVQEARQQQRCLQYENTVLRAAEEVDNSLVSYVRQKERFTRLERAVRASEESVATAGLREVGGDSFQRVLDTRRVLARSQDQLAISRANITISLIQLYRALGGGWEGATSVVSTPTEPTPDEMLPAEVAPTPLPPVTATQPD